ncbi:MAG: sugar phosphate isomerase/epimerase family protein, partial [Pirellulales bacterium]
MPRHRMSRRFFCRTAAPAVWTAGVIGWRSAIAASNAWAPRYILASPMYGTAPLAEVVPEVHKTGADAIDIWPRPHANHREQVDTMGVDAFRGLLADHQVRLGMITRYDLGPFRLQDEIGFLADLGGRVLVSGAERRGGGSLRDQVVAFVRKLAPQVAAAEARGVAIGIENHAGSLIHSPDSIRYFAEFATSPNLGIALAPYHLQQDSALITSLIETLGPSLVHFQAWQHGMGCMKKRPKEQELLQMPGRGPLDFRPLLAALRRIDYAGYTEIFMHPHPRRKAN